VYPVEPKILLRLETMNKKATKAPKHLKDATQRWFEQVTSDYELEPHHVRLLALAGESWDRGQQARAIIERDGLTYVDRFGCPKARPEIAIERDSRIAFARLLRELALDVDAPADDMRPPSIAPNSARKAS